MTDHFFAGRNSHLGYGLVTLCSFLFGCGSDEADPISRGREAVVTQACETCHTPQSDTAQTLAGADAPQPNSKAYPANLTPDMETGLGSWDEATIIKAILTGVDDEASPLCPPMPHFTDRGMTEDQAKDIVAYLKSLPPVTHAVPESSCPPIK